jgi:hypothetical protein
MNRHAYRTLLTALIAAALLSACQSGPTIRANSDKSADLSAYRTYAFAPEVGTSRAGYSSLITTYFKDAIRREMDARGYKYSEDQPELLVNFNANARENVDIQSTPGPSAGYYGYRAGLYAAGPIYSGTEVETVRYKVGTANVDVVDARKKQLLWEGLAEGRLTQKAMKDPEAAIDKVVAAMFTKFPGRVPS